jgi:alkylation response protein AidB-like acyl-CoA dehydrogenase
MEEEPSMSDITSKQVIAAAQELAPLIRDMREELDATRHLPASLAKKMARAGLFQLHACKELGGPELSPLTGFRVIEELSKADGSAGWCAMIASALSLSTGWLAPEEGRKMFGDPLDVRMAGSIRPEGRAYPVEGGYRVEGQWNFASGVHHANWLYCTCNVMHDASTPEVRTLLVPAESAKIIDTWSVVGMCGTGSHDFVVDGVFVPTAHDVSRSKPPQASGKLFSVYNERLGQGATWSNTAANALGIARGAIDTFIDLATSTGSTMSTTLLRDRALVQMRLAEAEAIVSAARAYVLESVRSAWEAAGDGTLDGKTHGLPLRLAITHSMHEAVRAVDIVFHAAGTNAVYRKNPLERYFRDIHVAVQHAAALPLHIEAAGKVLMGYSLSEVGW